MMLSVMVVDDHPLTRMGISLLLQNTPDFRLAAEAEYGSQALELVSSLQPDILLLDYRLPDMSGFQVSAEIKKRNLKTRVLAFSAYSDEDYVIRMLNAGAQGYILKTDSPLLLLEALRSVAKGESWLSPSITIALLDRARRELRDSPLLSRREREVLRLLAKGYSNSQIANSLTISRATVKNHLSHIYNHLAVNSRAEAITWAWSNGLVA